MVKIGYEIINKLEFLFFQSEFHLPFKYTCVPFFHIIDILLEYAVIIYTTPLFTYSIVIYLLKTLAK